ncbi:MAG: NAD(P)/FAD-dependent oxidoreductase [Candidatus Aenigmarchaeota archaeon]|nr:NAD(P)/FAD-dependent oxidoreductase [Candidatus Aenigmarchaeota archaeon]
MKNSYDVIIVGAGPGGSVTAKHIAEAGLKVLLLEKRQEIGAPKRCGEGIGHTILDRLGYGRDERFVCQHIDGGILYAPSGKALEIPGGEGGAVIERKVFDKFLAYDAAKAGVEIRVKTEVVGLLRDNNEKITGVEVVYEGKKYQIRAKIVVASDGIESKIGRMAGLKYSNNLVSVDSGYQYEMANIDIPNPKKLYFYLGRKIAPRGYIWIFPKGKHVANVGIGIGGVNEKTAKQYLDEWIKNTDSVKKGAIIEENAGAIPIGNFLEKMTSDNFLAVGDAAHQVNPVHGGGLAEATYAGVLAAKAIVDAIKAGNTSAEGLDEYNILWWNERGNQLRKVEKVVNAFENMSDDAMNLISESFTGEDIVGLSDGRTAKLMKLVLKNPRLLGLAKYLK